MKRQAILLLFLPIFGTLLGFWLGWSQRSPLWPEASRLNMAWRTGQGWLAGVGLWGLFALLLRRIFPPEAKIRRKQLLEYLTLLIALTPIALWITLAIPGGVMQEAAPPLITFGEKRPNIVFIGIDALRADHIGVYGSSAGLTPNLDAFAKDATVYESAYVAAPWTLSSLAAIFTSLAPSQCVLSKTEGEEVGPYVDRVTLRSEVEIFPTRLQQAGYVTAAELTNPFLAAERGWVQGFRDFRNEDGSMMESLITKQSTRAETLTQNAVTWLRLNQRRPFFFWIHYLDPHAPYDSPDTPEGRRKKYPSEWDTRRAYYVEQQSKREFIDPDYEQFCRDMYAEEVRYVDRWVGVLLDELKRLKSYDNSLIIIMSDHGEELFEHGGFEHGHSLHEETLHVPLLIKWPAGVMADRRITQTVALTELAATCLELAKAPRGSIKGKQLTRSNGEVGSEVFSEGLLYGPEKTALTTDSYKVIYHPDSDDEFEVYDRKSDRGEGHNLAGTKVAERQRARLKDLTELAMADRVTANKRENLDTQISEEARRKLRGLGYL